MLDSVNNAFLKKAQSLMPSGVADSYRYWGYDKTIFIKSTSGYMIEDHDGNSYADFRLGYGPVILGYRDKRVDDAVVDCITQRGVLTGFSTELEIGVVETVKDMCPNVEKLRFANSGTEAVMASVRTARGATDREKLIIVEGGFHGLYDEMMWKADVPNWNPETERTPKTVSFGKGVAAATKDLVTLVPLNDIEALQAAFAPEHAEETAAIIIEPIMGNCGSIEATQDYMNEIRSLCDATGVVMIIDEVKTGFRVAKGGVQELYGVHADITTYAKAIGNGYAIAAFGGRASLMDHITFENNGVTHGGTYTANPVAISAAAATLEVLSQTNALETVSKNGRNFQKVLGGVFEAAGVPYRFTGPNAMFGVHFTDSYLADYRQWKRSDSSLYERFAYELIANGLIVEPDSREPWFICEAHRDVDLQWLEETAKRSLTSALNQ